MKFFTESIIENAALAWLEGMDYKILFGPEIVPGELQAEREHYGQVILERRLRQALQQLNPQAPADALEDAFRKLTRPESASLVSNNHTLHKYLVEGVPVEVLRPDGSIGGDIVRVLDFEVPDANEFLAVNQFTVVEERYERRPDIVLFVNGLPLAVIELKNAAAENATIWSAFNQLQTYKQQIPSLFAFNEAMIISDGVQARIGTLTADKEWFMPWRTIYGESLADFSLPQLEVVMEGVFDKRRFLTLIRHFIVFEDTGGGVLIKKMAGYHQYHAVNVALSETLRACTTMADFPAVRTATNAVLTCTSLGGIVLISRAGKIGHSRAGAEGFKQGHVDGMILMITGHFLDEDAAAGILKYNEVANKGQKPPFVENPFHDNLQLRQGEMLPIRRGVRAHEPFLVGRPCPDPGLDYNKTALSLNAKAKGRSCL